MFKVVQFGLVHALVAPVPPGTWRVTVSRGLEYDAFVDAGGAKDQAQALFDKIAAAFKHQLAEALEYLPEDARAGVIV